MRSSIGILILVVLSLSACAPVPTRVPGIREVEISEPVEASSVSVQSAPTHWVVELYVPVREADYSVTPIYDGQNIDSYPPVLQPLQPVPAASYPIRPSLHNYGPPKIPREARQREFYRQIE